MFIRTNLVSHCSSVFPFSGIKNKEKKSEKNQKIKISRIKTRIKNHDSWKNKNQNKNQEAWFLFFLILWFLILDSTKKSKNHWFLPLHVWSPISRAQGFAGSPRARARARRNSARRRVRACKCGFPPWIEIGSHGTNGKSGNRFLWALLAPGFHFGACICAWRTYLRRGKRFFSTMRVMGDHTCTNF